MLKTAVECLRFDHRGPEALRSIPEQRLSEFLSLTDRAYLTLPVSAHWGDAAPPIARHHLDGVVTKNARRHEAIVTTCKEISDCLQSEGLEFVFLKGLTQWPYYCETLALRPQFDIDLYCPESVIARAQSSLIRAGWEPLTAAADLPTDHMPPLVRRTAWRWRGDFYDPEMPLTIELHRTFWAEDYWGFPVHGVEDLWKRRTVRQLAGLPIPALDPVDGLSYTAWHMLRHLLGGDLRPYHVYELAHFLDRSASDSNFWSAWNDRGEPRQRIPESIAFRLAEVWFGCRIHPVVAECISALPHKVQRWFSLFADSPMAAAGESNKDALILHLALVRRFDRRLGIGARRIAPMRMPPALLYDKAFERGSAGRIFSRASHHLRAVLALAHSTLRWIF